VASDIGAILEVMSSSDRQRPDELLAALVESFATVSPGGFCGQTHVHKAAFIAQELLGVPLGLNWEMYTYGPFSRDVRPGLARCEQRGMVAVQKHPKGLRIKRPVGAPRVQLPLELREKVQLVARRLAPMDRDQLEKVATAAWVTRSNHERGMSVRARAAAVHEIKPHIDTDVAAKAVEYLDDLISRSTAGAGGVLRPDPELMRRLAARTAELYPPGGSLEVYRPGVNRRQVPQIGGVVSIQPE
jgi:hypothetical protein